MKISRTFFWKYFENLAETHKQWHKRAFKTTSSNKTEIANVRTKEIIKEDASFKVQKGESMAVLLLL